MSDRAIGRIVAVGLLSISLWAATSQIAAADANDALAESFRQYDVDGSGSVSRSELLSVDAFERLDRDGNGAITLAETRAAVAAGALKGVTLPDPVEVKEAAPIEAAEPQDEIRQGPKVISPSENGVGRLVADTEFRDINGQQHRLSDFAKHKALVIALTGTGCPLCQKYAPTLADLERKYRDRDVAFVFINPNESEKIDMLKETVRTHGFAGPYVRDLDEVILTAVGAKTTTEVFVLDAARTLVYRGAVDDQYGFGYSLNAPRKTYAVDAIEAVIGGRRVEIAATSAPGCELFYQRQSDPIIAQTTYHNRVSRIIQNHCLECHREGGLAPFPLASFEDARDYAAMIKSVVRREVMPPWFAASQPPPAEGHAGLGIRWANDRSMPAADRRDLLAWIDSGATEGDLSEAPLPRHFPEHWSIGNPDLVVEIPKPIDVKATGRMPYVHTRVTTTLDEDRWVQAVEIQPTERAVVHHVLVFVNEKGQGRDEIDEEAGFFAAYVPGNTYQQYPQGMAKKLPAGATLIFQLHYTPNGTATVDQTTLGIVFADEPPQHMIRNKGIANHKIEIPPGAANDRETASVPVPDDVQLISLLPHMHLRGKAFRYDVTFPDGRKETLLDVPRYDFNWQLEYRLAEPLNIPQGSQIDITGWFDNSEGNPANPDPTATVKWGPQTEDEMLLGYVEYYLTSEPTGAPTDSDEAESASLQRAFRKTDKNHDGQVTPDEFPQRQLFKRLDSDSDGAVTIDELLSSSAELRGRLSG
jgi:Ca2+-binding EF-hand superfamily protein/thiol-disulfide isomerase/thioredoxin